MEVEQHTAANIICRLCDSGADEDRLMLCDGCDKGFHTYCLNLPAVPTGEWYCPACRRASQNNNVNNNRVVQPPLQLAPRQQVHLYERVSSKDQDDPKYGRVGLDTQNNSLLECVLKRGLVIKETVREVGSARHQGKRPLFNRLSKKLKKGDFVLVYSVSRFCRNLNEGQEMLRLIHDKGAHVYSVAENVYSNEDLFLLLMRSAENESNDISNKVKASIARIRQQGGHIGSAPFGFDIYREESGLRKLSANPEETAILNRIKNKTVSAEELANKLNAEGKSNRGKPWTKDSINRIHKRFAGERADALEKKVLAVKTRAIKQRGRSLKRRANKDKMAIETNSNHNSNHNSSHNSGKEEMTMNEQQDGGKQPINKRAAKPTKQPSRSSARRTILTKRLSIATRPSKATKRHVFPRFATDLIMALDD